jgi:putative tricarboxylic transport membrane protein
MRGDVRHLRIPGGVLFCMSISLVLFSAAVDGIAADLSVDYPSRPISFVIHGSPGGANDAMVRLISDIIQKDKILNQPLIVLNKPSSGGAIAMGYVFERKGNPYIIYLAISGGFIMTPLMEKLPYNYKSFVPIANMTVDGSVLVVRSDSPFKTADDLIAEARKRPKELIMGGAGFLGTEAMTARNIQKLKGVQWNFISFTRGDVEALLNLLGGNIHFAFINPSSVMDYVRSGKVRILLAGSPNRYPQFKDVPTMKEAGFGEPILVYRGIVGPPNMPDYAVRKMEATFKKVAENDRWKKLLEDLVIQPFWLPSREYSELLDERDAQWKKLLSELDLLKKK